MGNQQSGSPPPPIPPVCDSDCQRQQLLTGLKTTMDQKEETQNTDPEGYEQARIAYYTALNGPGWLAQEQNNIATNEIAPVVTNYTNQFNQLNSQLKTNKTFSQLASLVEADEKDNQEDLKYLRSQIRKEKDQADVLNRLEVLSNTGTPIQTSSFNYLPVLADIGIALLGLFIVYMIYTKFSILKGYFGFGQQSSVPVGGKRLP